MEKKDAPRVIVTGSRDLPVCCLKKVKGRLEALPGWPNWVVVEGGAGGADLFARSTARVDGAWSETFKADWEKMGNAAGPYRNRQMLAAGADLVLAFPMGESRGTRDMIKVAREAGVTVEVCESEADKQLEFDFGKKILF